MEGAMNPLLKGRGALAGPPETGYALLAGLWGLGLGKLEGRGCRDEGTRCPPPPPHRLAPLPKITQQDFSSCPEDVGKKYQQEWCHEESTCSRPKVKAKELPAKPQQWNGQWTQLPGSVLATLLGPKRKPARTSE